MVELPAWDRKVAGSNPASQTKISSEYDAVGSVPALQVGSREFEPHYSLKVRNWEVISMGCGSGGGGKGGKGGGKMPPAKGGKGGGKKAPPFGKKPVKK